MPSTFHNSSGAVLVLDSDPRFLAWCAKRVGECDARMIGGDSIESAERLLSSSEFRAIVVSRDLPGNRNLEFVSRVAVELPGVFAVVVTDRAVDATAHSAESGIVQELRKPFTAECFCSALHEAMRLGAVAKSLLANSDRMDAWLKEVADVRTAVEALYATPVSSMGVDRDLQMIDSAMTELSASVRRRADQSQSRQPHSSLQASFATDVRQMLHNALAMLSRCRVLPVAGPKLRQRINSLLTPASAA